MTRAEVLDVLRDGGVHVLEGGALETLIATGLAEFVAAATFEDGAANRRRGLRPVRITEAGRRRAVKGNAMFATPPTKGNAPCDIE